LNRTFEQFQQKCEAVLRPELRKNKGVERFRDSKKSGNALSSEAAKITCRLRFLK